MYSQSHLAEFSNVGILQDSKLWSNEIQWSNASWSNSESVNRRDDSISSGWLRHDHEHCVGGVTVDGELRWSGEASSLEVVAGEDGERIIGGTLDVNGEEPVTVGEGRNGGLGWLNILGDSLESHHDELPTSDSGSHIVTVDGVQGSGLGDLGHEILGLLGVLVDLVGHDEVLRSGNVDVAVEDSAGDFAAEGFEWHLHGISLVEEVE